MLQKYKSAGSYSNLRNRMNLDSKPMNTSEMQSPSNGDIKQHVFYQNYINSNIPKGPWASSGLGSAWTNLIN